ncbi:MAG: acyltransferase [Deltaproteobacteria bacterium]|nr:acyltransferase [Deltaproteobacteria bacterium]
MDAKPATARLEWLDVMKGISILWIAYFHGFRVLVGDGRFPGALSGGYLAGYWASCRPQSWLQQIACGLEAYAVGFGSVGFHAVSVFLVLSGFGLVYSLARTGGPARGWVGWYRARLLRLFPMYWIAHVVYLVSPFQVRYEPIDYRFLLSFLGDRVYPVETIFYYFNPALWYFGLLLELYLVFPLLFRLLQRAGVAWFLALSLGATLGARYVMLCVFPVNGYYVQGAFFLPRLWEFALGMALGLLYRTRAADVDRRLFSPPALAAGAALYTLGLYSYATLWSYTFTDALIGTGLAIVLAHVARAAARAPRPGAVLAAVGAYSYGLYLLHQPYVLYFATLGRHLATPSFVAMICALIAVLALAAMALERQVNRLTQRVLG